jgi:hypothetical protein
MGLILYGERGLVNAVILEIKDNPDLIKKVLGSVKLGDGKCFTWLETLERVDFWIEPSFGQFGNPDLIAICYCKNGFKNVIFFEAKTVTYEDSAVPLAGPYIPGINSRINAQLTLKHRFVQALIRTGFQQGFIGEGENASHAYARLSTDSKPPVPRILKNEYVVSTCRKMQANCKDFYFVALTNDLPGMNFGSVESKHLPLPVLFDDQGHDIWSTEKDRFGFLTFTDLERILPPEGLFMDTRKIVLPNPKPISPTGETVLRTTNWKEFSHVMTEVRSTLQRSILDAAAEAYGGDRNQSTITLHEYEGSDSFKGPGGNTIVKIIPYRNQNSEDIRVVIKDSLVRAAEAVDYFNEGPFQIGIGSNSRTFYGRSFKIPLSEDELNICQGFMVDVLGIN